MEQAIPYIVTGVIIPVALYFFYRKMDKSEKRRDQKEEQRAKARQKENIIIMKSLKSLGHLGEATAIALKDGKINGEMTRALSYYTETKDELNDFLYEQNAKTNYG
jgi:hypothetical protein